MNLYEQRPDTFAVAHGPRAPVQRNSPFSRLLQAAGARGEWTSENRHPSAPPGRRVR